jgi:chromate transporter
MREVFILCTIIAPLSVVAFGGATSIYAPLQHQLVDVHHWLTAREFIDYFAIARVTPGPGSMMTTLLGWKVGWLAGGNVFYGFFGAFLATLALYLPACLMCYGASRVWGKYRGTPWHTALEAGLTPIGAGLIFSGVLALTRMEAADPLSWGIMAVVALALTLRPRMHPLIVLAGGSALFVALRLLGA